MQGKLGRGPNFSRGRLSSIVSMAIHADTCINLSGPGEPKREDPSRISKMCSMKGASSVSFWSDGDQPPVRFGAEFGC